jgi:hypothetical protein
MKGLLKISLLVLSLTLLGVNGSRKLCEGFLPENKMRIPVNSLLEGGITEQQFNNIMDKIQKYYTPVFAAKNMTFTIERLWTDGTVNAYASREGQESAIHMYGGLARFGAMNEDGMLMVACHETGHHLGGAPKISSWFGRNDWASNEGEADYYATLRCMRFLMDPTETAAIVAKSQIDPVLRTNCEASYTGNDERNLCIREGMATMTVGTVFMTLKNDPQPPKFETPDPSQVVSTDDRHPATQCRVDTYYQAALCVHDLTAELSDTDYKIGACSDTAKAGVRPRCWFQPNAAPVNVLAEAN